MVEVSDILHKNIPIFTEDFGVEIEIEGSNFEGALNYLPKNWRVERDGSLRNGFEYVLFPPKNIKELEKNIDALQNFLSEKKVRIKVTERTGTHLHLNVLKLTPIQLVNFMCCYYILEEALIEICGENRIGNHFCLRAVDADYIIRFLCESLESNNIFKLRNDIIRYSALNFCSLFKFGTLEFRAIQTNKVFKVNVIKIAKILLLIKKYSVSLESPENILYEFSDAGPEVFLKNLLGENFNLISNTTNFNLKCKRGMRFAQDIIYSRDFKKSFDWGFIKNNKKDFDPFGD